MAPVVLVVTFVLSTPSALFFHYRRRSFSARDSPSLFLQWRWLSSLGNDLLNLNLRFWSLRRFLSLLSGCESLRKRVNIVPCDIFGERTCIEFKNGGGDVFHIFKRGPEDLPPGKPVVRLRV
jgi:hypothetical protein